MQSKTFSNISNTISGYKIAQRCEVIFFQDNDKNHCIALLRNYFLRKHWKTRMSRLDYFICANGVITYPKKLIHFVLQKQPVRQYFWTLFSAVSYFYDLPLFLGL